MLIIEEAQEKNMLQPVIGRDFVTFFLRLLNWGIPTVLMGNPLAFTKLQESSQDVDRFSEGGWFRLHPQMDHQSEEWTEDWLPSLWNPTLLDYADAGYMPISEAPLDQTLAGFVWRRTAGIPRYVCRLRREVQEYALRIGASQVTAEMVDAVYHSSEKMSVLHQRIDAFVKKDWRTLKRFDDIPWDYFRRLWNPMQHEEAEFDAPEKTDPEQKPNAKITTRSAAPKKPRVTKANPPPPEALSPMEVKAKQFQAGMVHMLTNSANSDDS